MDQPRFTVVDTSFIHVDLPLGRHPGRVTESRSGRVQELESDDPTRRFPLSRRGVVLIRGSE